MKSVLFVVTVVQVFLVFGNPDVSVHKRFKHICVEKFSQKLNHSDKHDTKIWLQVSVSKFVMY